MVRKIEALIAIVVTVIAMTGIAVGCSEAERDATAEREGIQIEGYEGEYDGAEHGVRIEGIAEGSRVLYAREENGEYREEEMRYSEPGEYKVYVKVEIRGGTEYRGSGTVRIRKAVMRGVGSVDAEYEYDGEDHGLKIEWTEANDEVEYSDDGEEYGKNAVTKREIGEYRVYYRVERKYEYYSGSGTIRILPNIRGEYVNSEKGGITVEWKEMKKEGGTEKIEYGTDGKWRTEQGEEIEVRDGELRYDGAEYKKIDEGQHVCEITAGEARAYAGIADVARVRVEFEENVEWKVRIDGEIKITGTGKNYCERILEDGEKVETERSYSTTTVEATVRGDKVAIELSERKESEPYSEEREENYTGEEIIIEARSEWEVVYGTENGYTSIAPKYKDVGEYEIEYIELRSGYLPRRCTIRLKIIEDNSGVYYSLERKTVIELTKGMREIEGKRYEIKDGKLKIDGDETEYVKQTRERLLAVRRNGRVETLTQLGDDDVEIEITEMGVSVRYVNAAETVYTEDREGIKVTVKLNGDTKAGINGRIILGIGELNRYAVCYIDIDDTE